VRRHGKLNAARLVDCGGQFFASPLGPGSNLPRAQAPEWALLDAATRIERKFQFKNYGESFAFVTKAAELAEAEAHHPDISFGWGYATVSLRTKMIKGLHENDFIMAAKLDRLVNTGVPSRNGT
jgi:4a-hydroxytetrahydrobiopterin dehydratase